MLDPRLEEAAAGLAAVMQDLAGGSGGGSGGAGGQLTAAGEEGQQGGQRAEAEGRPGGGHVNPEAAARLASLPDRVRQLEEEIRGERPRGAEGGAGSGGEEGGESEAGGSGSEDEGEGLEIDSGDEGEGGSGSDDDGEELKEESEVGGWVSV